MILSFWTKTMCFVKRKWKWIEASENWEVGQGSIEGCKWQGASAWHHHFNISISSHNIVHFSKNTFNNIFLIFSIVFPSDCQLYFSTVFSRLYFVLPVIDKLAKAKLVAVSDKILPTNDRNFNFLKRIFDHLYLIRTSFIHFVEHFVNHEFLEWRGEEVT